ncbi:MAG: hypothetical protein KF684_06850 [Phycisphaeraceae bacterium]|nr:hypothetical protein [Phycisphaeraceae bacterium]
MLEALSESHAIALMVVVALALAGGGAFAALFRGARAPGGAIGAAILGGLLAGALLGDTVLARVAPDLAESLWTGGRAERLAFEERAISAEREVAVLRATGVTGVAIDEYAREVMAQVDPLRDALVIARAERAGWINALLAIFAAGALAISPLAGWQSRARARERAANSREWIAGGIGSFLLASVFAYVCLTVLTSAEFGARAALACAAGVGWLAPLPERARVAPRRERSSALLAGAAGLLPALVACVWLLPDRRSGALVVGVLAMSLVVASGGALARRRRARRLGRAIALGAVVPALAALASSRVDWLGVVESPVFWIALVVAALASSDGRWFGALLGSRSIVRTTAIVTAGVGVPQIALLLLFDAGGPMPGSFLAAGLLGALVVECSAGLYRWAMRWFVREAARTEHNDSAGGR